jgi:hypothetical protein
MTLRQYIEIMDALIGVELSDDLTATDLFISHPDKAYAILRTTTGKTDKELKGLTPTQIAGMLDIAVSGIQIPTPYEVPFIEIGNSKYTACKPLLMEMSDDKIVYGEITFGNCLEAFNLLDKATHQHRAIPMVLAYVYEGNNHPTERAKEFMDMDYRDAVSAFFFFARLGTGYITHLSSQLAETIAPQNTKQLQRKQVKDS